MTIRTLVCSTVIIAAGLGLTACIGPNDDGYNHSRTRYQSNPNYYYDNGYEQRRNSIYGQYPYASSDQQRWNDNWWRGTAYSRNNYPYER